jgi:hypothetical protein
MGGPRMSPPTTTTVRCRFAAARLEQAHRQEALDICTDLGIPEAGDKGCWRCLPIHGSHGRPVRSDPANESPTADQEGPGVQVLPLVVAVPLIAVVALAAACGRCPRVN